MLRSVRGLGATVATASVQRRPSCIRGRPKLVGQVRRHGQTGRLAQRSRRLGDNGDRAEFTCLLPLARQIGKGYDTVLAECGDEPLQEHKLGIGAGTRRIKRCNEIDHGARAHIALAIATTWGQSPAPDIHRQPRIAARPVYLPVESNPPSAGLQGLTSPRLQWGQTLALVGHWLVPAARYCRKTSEVSRRDAWTGDWKRSRRWVAAPRSAG